MRIFGNFLFTIQTRSVVYLGEKGIQDTISNPAAPTIDYEKS